jgi:2,5-diketo-D-gluconate reductase A
MVALNSGARMPQVGFSVFRIADDDLAAAVLNALDCGYRDVDTASLYGNERGVGRAIERSGLSREDIFVTTKLWNGHHGIDRAPSPLRAGLDRPGLNAT